jgi:hypothetical protein
MHNLKLNTQQCIVFNIYKFEDDLTLAKKKEVYLASKLLFKNRGHFVCQKLYVRKLVGRTVLETEHTKASECQCTVVLDLTRRTVHITLKSVVGLLFRGYT